ncbi:hypothetical protein COEX109129_42175 [Corallococcus exiguus]
MTTCAGSGETGAGAISATGVTSSMGSGCAGAASGSGSVTGTSATGAASTRGGSTGAGASWGAASCAGATSTGMGGAAFSHCSMPGLLLCTGSSGALPSSRISPSKYSLLMMPSAARSSKSESSTTRDSARLPSNRRKRPFTSSGISDRRSASWW